MVQVDFSEFRSYSSCPVWWRNFVDTILKDFSMPGSTDERNQKLDFAITRYNGSIIDHDSGPDGIDRLEFETEDDLNAFKLFWTIHGK
jgi:hypothetical protein